MTTAGEAERWWRDLEGRIRPFVARRVASPADVDDVLQDVFVRMQKGLGAVRDERLAPWLFAVARSAIAEYRRDRARHPLTRKGEHPIESADDEPDERERAALEGALAGCVARFVRELPSPYREAITLVEIEGMSQKQAAEVLGLSHSGMKSRVQRGREQLRAMFERACALELDARRRVTDCAPRACDGCAPGADQDAS